MVAMKTPTAIAVCYLILGAARGDDPCLNNPGCFPDGHPLSATLELSVGVPAQSPEEIGTQYFLLTRDNPEHPQVISAMNLTAFNDSYFRTSRRTVLIAHGLDDRAHDNWVSEMCHELLRKEDVNCIGVDWSKGSGNILTYLQAISNMRVVGTQVCDLLKTLFEERNYSLSNIHIIGHSLGAHLAGEAGKQCPGINRITGLDPAGPLFKGKDKEDRLDRSDALHVDAIYTDIEALLGLGIAQAIAHLNFYPNGGEHMPGCPIKVIGLLNVPDLKESVACDHFRAYRYFTDTIRSPEGYISYPCDSYENFKSGACFPCTLPQGCPTMGYFVDRWFNTSDQKQMFFLNTGGNTPHYHIWRYKVSITLNGRTSGSTYISFYGSGGNVTDHQMGSSLTLIPRNHIAEFMDSPVKLHPLHSVTFHWTSAIFSLFKTQLGAARIDIQTGEDGKTSSFCSTETVLDGVVQVLDPCD